MNRADGLPILLVDDDESTRKLLQALMVRYGFTSELAVDGQEAIDRIEAGDYGAIVLDLMMPAVGGYDVIAYLQSKERRIPVIVCTAAGPAATAGFDPDIVKAVVRKPFDIDQFITIIRQLTGRS